uniref:Uncharacterized protein n=1 Tax=Mesocestoides corti TaxID=53468 RepID=A0A5K3FKM4_MESCO
MRSYKPGVEGGGLRQRRELRGESGDEVMEQLLGQLVLMLGESSEFSNREGDIRITKACSGSTSRHWEVRSLLCGRPPAEMKKYCSTILHITPGIWSGRK